MMTTDPLIGVKLVLHAMHENNVPFINGGESINVVEISTGVSLTVIVGLLTVTVVVLAVEVGAHVFRRAVPLVVLIAVATTLAVTAAMRLDLGLAWGNPTGDLSPLRSRRRSGRRRTGRLGHGCRDRHPAA